jgi:DNA mismatch repair protein MutS2
MHDILNSIQKLEFDKVIKYIQRYSISDLGREQLAVLAPSNDISEIKYSLSLVSEMKQLIESDESLPIENIFDVRIGLQRSSIENYILSAEDIYKIGLLLNTARQIHIYFNRRNKVYPLLFERVKEINVEKILEYNINQAIDESGKVRDDASKELLSIRKQIIDKSHSIKRNLELILKSIGGADWIQEEIITTREGRMVIPVKVEHKNRLPGFIHSASASGATVYIEPAETLEMNNEIRTLSFQELREVERILKALTKQVSEAKNNIYRNLQILAEMDFIQAKAKYSIEVLGAEPIIKTDGSIRYSNSYHPILLQRHGRSNVIPLNMEIPSEINTIIITGPNAGGKSVAMKTVGLLSLLAQSGCHIPASPETELKVFSNYFVDIGDEQSIENDLSSFSSHLKNLKLILENANSTSLVLVDEIGSGTDPVEGAALAASILEHLTRIKSMNIATTHHGTLKSFAFETQHIDNAAMEFDTATLKPTYKFRLGIPGSSYAIEMAERLNLLPSVVDRSRELKGTDSNRLENLITDLERKSLEFKLNLDQVNQEKKRLDNLNLIYETKITTLQKELKDIKLRALDEAKQIVINANAIIEKSIREIKETSANHKVIKRAKEEIKQESQKYSQQLEKMQNAPEEKEFSIGDKVSLRKCCW